MKVSVAVVWQAGCPTCHVACGVQCRTPSRRNHPARVRAAIEQSLYDLQFPDEDLVTQIGVGRMRVNPKTKSLAVTNMKGRETQSFMDSKYQNRETSHLGKGGSYSVFLEGQAAAANVKLMKRVRKKKPEAPAPGGTAEPTSSTIVVDTGVAGEGEGAPPALDSVSP